MNYIVSLTATRDISYTGGADIVSLTSALIFDVSIQVSLMSAVYLTSVYKFH